MPITTKDRYFGEGIPATGLESPQDAFRYHLNHVRAQRLNDLLGKEFSLDVHKLINRFEDITGAIEAADAQVRADNDAWMKSNGITY